MKSHGFEMEGPFKSEIVSTLPAWQSGDEGREIYVEADQKRYYGGSTTWIDYSSGGGGGSASATGFYYSDDGMPTTGGDTPTPVLLDVIVIESDKDIIALDSTSQTKIYVYETGIYLVSYSGKCSGAEAELALGINVNGRYGPPPWGDGGKKVEGDYVSGSNPAVEPTLSPFVQKTIPLPLTAGDYIEFMYHTGEDGTNSVPSLDISIIKM